MIQQTLIIIKPDGLIKSLTGNIISVLSEVKLKIVGAKIVSVSKELAEKHYQEHREKPFFVELVNYLMGKYHTNRVLAMVYQGEDAIEKIRALCGSTNPEKADPISIRGKYGRINSQTQVFENAIHASDSVESAEKEIKLWFKPDELTEKIFPTKKTTKKCVVEEWA